MNSASVRKLLGLAGSVGLATAADHMIKIAAKHTQGNPRYWAIFDVRKHSREERLHVFDIEAGTMESLHVAHGSGSDPGESGFPTLFSNKSGSNCTSLGVYRVGEIYSGKHGNSCRLDGLEESNSHARARAVVLHGAKYCEESYVKRVGRCGRSWGCPAVGDSKIASLIAKLSNGSYLNISK